MNTSKLISALAPVCVLVTLAGCPATDDPDNLVSSSSSGSSETSSGGSIEDGTTGSDTGGAEDPPRVLDVGDELPSEECGPDFNFVRWDGNAPQLLGEVGAGSAFVGVGDCTMTAEGEDGQEAWTLLELACVMDGARDAGTPFEQEDVAFSVLLRRPEGDMPTTEEALGSEVTARLVVTPGVDRFSNGNVWLVFEAVSREGLVPTLVITAADALAPPADAYAPYYDGADWYHGPTVATAGSGCMESDACALHRSIEFGAPGLQPITVHPNVSGWLEQPGGAWRYAVFPEVATEPTGERGCMVQFAELRFVLLSQAEFILK